MLDDHLGERPWRVDNVALGHPSPRLHVCCCHLVVDFRGFGAKVPFSQPPPAYSFVCWMKYERGAATHPPISETPSHGSALLPTPTPNIRGKHPTEMCNPKTGVARSRPAARLTRGTADKGSCVTLKEPLGKRTDSMTRTLPLPPGQLVLILLSGPTLRYGQAVCARTRMMTVTQ